MTNLSQRTQERLAKLISVIAECEKKTEMVRQVLAEQKMFEPYTAFKRLDQSRTGSLTISDLVDFLSDNKVEMNKGEGKYLFMRLDANRDGTITYPDFVKSVLPREDQRLRQLASLRDSYYLETNMLLPYEVEWALARVLDQDVKNYTNIMAAQEILTSSLDFSSIDAFRCIDVGYNGFITLDNLHEFTKKNGSYLSTDELLAFFRVVDLDEDGRISYTELLEAITLVPNYFSARNKAPQSPVVKDLQRSRELVNTIERNIELERELRRSRERERELEVALEVERSFQLSRSRQLSEELRKSRERELNLQYEEYARRSRERVLQLEELRNSRERSSQLEQLRRSRELQEEVQKQQDRLEALRRSRLYDEELKKSRERTEELQQQRELKVSRDREQQLEALKRSRERLEELERDLEQSRQTAKKVDGSAKKVDESAKLAQSRLYETPKREHANERFVLKFPRCSKYQSTPAKQLRESRMKGNEEHKFVQALKEQIELSKELEDIKSQLAFKSDFHPQGAFALLDPNQRGHLTKLDFELVVNDFGLFPTPDQIRLFFARYCPDTSFLTYKAFLDSVVPASEQYSQLMLSRKQDGEMSIPTKALFLTLLKKHFQVEDSYEQLRCRLTARNNFNITQAFQSLDVEDMGFITQEHFQELFKRNQVFATVREVQGLVHLYDRNKDGKVSYQEFISEISPKRPLRL